MNEKPSSDVRKTEDTVEVEKTSPPKDMVKNRQAIDEPEWHIENRGEFHGALKKDDEESSLEADIQWKIEQRPKDRGESSDDDCSSIGGEEDVSQKSYRLDADKVNPRIEYRDNLGKFVFAGPVERKSAPEDAIQEKTPLSGDAEEEEFWMDTETGDLVRGKSVWVHKKPSKNRRKKH